MTNQIADLLSKCQNKWKITPKFCGLLRKAELYYPTWNSYSKRSYFIRKLEPSLFKMMATDDVHTPYTRKHLFWRVDFNISFDLAGNLAASTLTKRGNILSEITYSMIFYTQTIWQDFVLVRKMVCTFVSVSGFLNKKNSARKMFFLSNRAVSLKIVSQKRTQVLSFNNCEKEIM